MHTCVGKQGVYEIIQPAMQPAMLV